MKTKYTLLSICLAGQLVYGQGVFVFDQQSTNYVEGSTFFDQTFQPVGQSFAPSLSSVGFVQFNLYDADIFHNAGATVYVNLRSDSITGPILGSSEQLVLPNEFSGLAVFLFSTPVTVSPGLTYFFQPVIQSGDSVGTPLTDGSYAGGIAYSQGLPWANHNLWFQEGTVVPEPSSVALAVLGSSGLLCFRKRKR